MTTTAPATKDFTQVTEGKANILFPKDHVFYNPVQQFNRDLSIVVIRTWSEAPQTKTQLRQAAFQERKFQTSTDDDAENEIQGRKVTILEALSASGLRAIRFALEIPNARVVYANDMSADAVAAINRNIAHNAIPEGKISVSCSDANALMYSHQTKRIDVIDLDPYGTAAPFIDAAIQALASDALLCVTCTDLSVLAGPAYPEKCYANYGGVPAKQEYTHEVVHLPEETRVLTGVGKALRLVLNTIAISAARYGRAIEPLLCLSIDFYVRLFLRVVQSPLQVKYLPRYTLQMQG
jgi:tRNA(guanine-26,N2-N2) methyltransferase